MTRVRCIQANPPWVSVGECGTVLQVIRFKGMGNILRVQWDESACLGHGDWFIGENRVEFLSSDPDNGANPPAAQEG